MKISDLVQNEHFKILNQHTYEDREINYLRCCDLLSWVMAKGAEGDAWITVQTHANIVAVSTLLEISCIILPESIKPDIDTLNKAEENQLAIISCDLDAFRIFKILDTMGL